MSSFSLPAAEKWSLLALVAFLPAVEAPKNLAIVLYLLFWLLNRLRSKEWGGTWSLWETLVALVVAGAYASAVCGAFIPKHGAAAANDVLCYGLVFLALRRSRLEPGFVAQLFAVALVSTLLTLVYGYWGWLIAKTNQTLGLNSVGHVNHSALYMAIVFAAALSWTVNMAGSTRQRIGLSLATLVLWISLLLTSARGALIPAIVFVFIWLAVWALQRGMAWWKPVLPIFLLFGVGILLAPGILEKTKQGVESGQIGSFRPALAKTALLAAREYPVFGIGITNFEKVSPELAASWQSVHGQMFPAEDLYFASHAHNLYANTLAERGVLGFLPMLVLLAALGVALVRRRPAGDSAAFSQALWGGALGAWLILVVGGLFNTTLHHENAMLGMILMGIWLGQSRVTGHREA